MEQKPNSDINQWVNSVVNLHLKQKLYEPSIDLVDSNVYTKFRLMLFIHSQDIVQNPYFILKLIKGATLLQICTHKKNIYNPSLNLVNDNVYTIFGLILMSIKGRNSVTNLEKNNNVQSQSKT